MVFYILDISQFDEVLFANLTLQIFHVFPEETIISKNLIDTISYISKR